MKQYVAGFLFSNDQKSVALIRKNRPEWQAGKLNAIGGKIELNEWHYVAMQREFREETGVDLPPSKWNRFATIRGVDYICYFYRCFDDSVFTVKTMESEEVFVISVDELHNYDHIPNLNWLIPLALDHTINNAEITE